MFDAVRNRYGTVIKGITRDAKRSADITLSNFGRVLVRTRVIDGFELAIARARGPAQFDSPQRVGTKSGRMARRTRILPLVIWRGLWCLRTDLLDMCMGVEPPQDVERQIARDAQYHPVFHDGGLLWRDRRAFFGSTHNRLEIGGRAGFYVVVFPVGALFVK